MSALALDWSRAVEGLARAHLHFLWQGALVALVLAAALALVPARKARVRYALACLALLVAAVAPVLTVLRQQPPAPAAPALASAGPALAGPAAGTSPLNSAVAIASRAGVSVPSAPWFGSVQPWVVALWLLGVGWLSVRNLRGWRRVGELERLDTSAVPAPWDRRFARLCQAMGMRRAVRFLRSTRVEGPVAVGWLRPVVLVPASALTGLSFAQLEAVLAHELAHIRRNDYLVNLIQVGVETLLFYHPAVWWISRQVRVTREHCCDDVAVSMCGNRRTYATALTALEQGRLATPAFALPAAAGGLVARIRRVLRLEERAQQTSNQRIQGVGTMLAITAAFCGAIYLSCAVPVSAQESGTRRVVEPASSPATAPQEQRGLWLARVGEELVRLDLRPSDKRDSQWGLSVKLPSTQLADLSFGESVTFRLVREAGTFTFSGDLSGDPSQADGAGRYSLRADTNYVEYMAARGYRNLSGHDIFRLAALDVTRAFVGGLDELGYEVALDMLIKMAIHDVTPEYISALQAVGYQGLLPEKLVKMSIHDVTPEYAAGMARVAGVSVPADELIKLSIHDVTPAYAQEVRNLGYEGLELSTLRKLKIHDVTPEYIRAVESVLHEHVPLETVIKLSIHSVSDDYMLDMTTRLGDLSAKQLVKMKIHDVSAITLDDMTQLGYGNLTVEQAVKMQIHDVTPDYVRKLHAEGITGLSVEELVKRKIHGDGGHRHDH